VRDEPDRLEKGIRFGCGGLFGAVIGFFFIIEFHPDSSGGIALACVAGAVICGALAMRYGDPFWHGLKDWLWWV
jgi:hypothetical protein